ncbi:MAG TPA: sulfotransferase domain-containing protein, partial [Candidatus Binataceae bacterium]
VVHFAWAHGSFDEVLKSRPNLGSGNQYASHLKTWFDLFGRENVLVTMYDELRAQPQSYLDRVTGFMDVERIALSARPEIGDDVHSFARAPKNRKLARSVRKLMYWLQGHQAYGVSDLLERAGVWDFCYGRGELFGHLTGEQEQRLRERYLPEVEALEELLRIDLSAWKKPQARRATVA